MVFQFPSHYKHGTQKWGISRPLYIYLEDFNWQFSELIGPSNAASTLEFIEGAHYDISKWFKDFYNQ